MTDLDDETPTRMAGRDLMEKGLSVTIQSKPGAAAITYRITK